jgi:hypothetical protein
MGNGNKFGTYIKIPNVGDHLRNDLDAISEALGHSTRADFCRIELRKIANNYLEQLKIRPSSEGGVIKHNID